MRIRARCSALRVEIVFEGRICPLPDERRILGARVGEQVRVREVLLLADDRPVVFARTLFAERSRRGPWRLLTGLGARPLGEILFTQRRIQRGRLTVCALDRRDARYHRAHAALGRVGMTTTEGRLWARRSEFSLRGHGLLVTEVFFPAILDLS